MYVLVLSYILLCSPTFAGMVPSAHMKAGNDLANRPRQQLSPRTMARHIQGADHTPEGVCPAHVRKREAAHIRSPVRDESLMER